MAEERMTRKTASAARRVSTRTRFEVFKRDAFTCRYCGRTPPEVVLHIDHIVPRAEGGTDEFDNLATSCAPCNLGKSAQPLGLVRPDIDMDAATQEIMEREDKIRAYNAAKAAQAEREDADYRDVYEYWCHIWGDNEPPRHLIPYPNTLRRAVAEVGADAVKECVDITARRFDRLNMDACRYFGGVLKRKRAEADGRVVPCFYCGNKIVLDAGQDPSLTWMHNRCAQMQDENDIEVEGQASEFVHAASAQADEDEWYFHEDEIDIEIRAWDKLAEAAGF